MAAFTMAAVVAVTIVSAWAFSIAERDSASHHLLTVWWCAWVTALSTGLGAVPLHFLPAVDPFYLGLSNAIAAGMMLAACGGLVAEGLALEEAPTGALIDSHALHVGRATLDAAADAAAALLTPMAVGLAAIPLVVRVACGAGAGVGFIALSQRWLGRHEELKFAGFDAVSSRRMLLIVAVMTLHSLSEGVGIGVSFSSGPDSPLGWFITTALALHNVPEGLAVALVLVPRGVPVFSASVWGLLSSLPQPLMAVPAFLLVDQFLPLLPVGLGFAAGAMAWVALMDLIPEALTDCPRRIVLITSAVSAALMALVQVLLH